MAKLLEADLVVSQGTGLLINVVIPYRRQPIFSACVSLPAASQPCPVTPKLVTLAAWLMLWDSPAGSKSLAPPT